MGGTQEFFFKREQSSSAGFSELVQWTGSLAKSRSQWGTWTSIISNTVMYYSTCSRERSYLGRRGRRAMEAGESAVWYASRPYPTYHWQWIWMTDRERLTCALPHIVRNTQIVVLLWTLHWWFQTITDTNCLLCLIDSADGSFDKFIQTRY